MCTCIWLLCMIFIIILLAILNGDQNSSALAEHAWQQQHHVDWAAAEVLESTRNWYPRCMIESWHIHREANSMNRERGPLPHIYCSLLTEQKQRWRHHHSLCTVLCFCRRMHTTRMRSHTNHTHLPSPIYCSVCHFSHSPEDDTSIGVETLGLIIIEWLEREWTICYLQYQHLSSHTGIYKKKVGRL